VEESVKGTDAERSERAEDTAVEHLDSARE